MTLQQFMLGGVPSAPSYDEKVLSYSPLAYFLMNEASGNISSEVGGYTGTVTGASWLYRQTGIGDGGYSMDAQNNSDHYITASAGLETAFSETLGTYAVWLNYEAAGDYDANLNTIFHADEVAGPEQIRLRRGGSGSVWTHEYGGAGPDSVVYDNSAATGWHHWAITWNFAAGDIRIYYDGTERDSHLTGLSPITTARLWIIGDGGGGAYPPNALMSKPAIWTSELIAATITDLATL